MKASFLRRPTKPLNRSTARNAALINQFATPGLGSLLGGRFVAGIGQLLLALAGFTLVLAWFASLLLGMYNEIQGSPPAKPAGWLGGVGALTFVASWLWALVTSLSLLREARESPLEPPSQPPLMGKS